jgi:urease accessory protein
MFDAVSPSDSGAMQRAVGHLRVAFKRRGADTVLDTLYQQGCLKARFPRVDPGAWPVAVTLNTSGGVAGGDRLDVALDLAAGTRMTVTAQAAERFYRVIPGTGPSVVRTRIAVGDGAAMEWLPQETILFDRCALDRVLDIDLALDARFLGVEMLMFGRSASGERVETGSLRDLIRVRRDGVLLWHDAIRMDGAIDAALCRPAVANGARALATVLFVSSDAEGRLDDVRAALPADAEAGASAWNGMLLTRILAPDSASLRATVSIVLDVLRDGRALPRVWNC